jgi:hypothetical protein
MSIHHASARPAIDDLSATGSFLYLLASFMGAVWFLFDTWVGGHTVARALGYDVTPLTSPDYHTVVAAVVGGSIGGVINGLRSALQYCRTFDSRHVWKYVAAPWMGAALSLLTYALLTTTAAVLGGQPVAGLSADTVGIATPQLLSNFAVGALAGYGAKDAFIWLDAQVQKLFAVQPPPSSGRRANAAIARELEEAMSSTDGVALAVPAVSRAAMLEHARANGPHASRGESLDLPAAPSAPRLPGALAGLRTKLT